MENDTDYSYVFQLPVNAEHYFILKIEDYLRLEYTLIKVTVSISEQTAVLVPFLVSSVIGNIALVSILVVFVMRKRKKSPMSFMK